MAEFYLPICSENLIKFLTFGLISGDKIKPLSFKNGYVDDVLADFSGFIPLFNGKVPSKSIDRVSKVDENLCTCILKIDVKIFVKGIFYDEEHKEQQFPFDESHCSSEVLYVRGPLPLSCIQKIHFKLDGQKNNFLKDIPANFAKHSYLKTIKANPRTFRKLIKKDSDVANSNLLSADSNNHEGEASDSDDLQVKKNALPESEALTSEFWHKIGGYGGALSYAFIMSKNGKDSLSKYRKLVDDDLNRNKSNDSDSKENYDFDFIYKHFCTLPTDERENHSFSNTIYSGILECLSKTSPDDCAAEIVKLLRSSQFESHGEKYTKRVHEIASELEMLCHTRYKGTPADELRRIRTAICDKKKQNNSYLKLGLCCMVLKKTGLKVLDYHENFFDEKDYLFFSLLAGICDSFSGIEATVRSITGLQSFVSMRMATLAHKLVGSDLEFKQIKSPPALITIFEDKKKILVFNSIAKKLNLDNEKCFESEHEKDKDYRSTNRQLRLAGIQIPTIQIKHDEYTLAMMKKKVEDIPYNDIIKKYQS